MALLPRHQQSHLLLLAPQYRHKSFCAFSLAFPRSFETRRESWSGGGRERPLLLRAEKGRRVVAMAGKRGDVRVFEGVQELVTSLADHIAELSDAATKERGSFSVALSGGSLISTMSKLCEPPYLKAIDWSKWHVFWADERVVPLNHEDSNYKLAKDGLLSKEKRQKLDFKSRKLLFLGYSAESDAYRLYDPDTRTTTVSRDVVFDESFITSAEGATAQPIPILPPPSLPDPPASPVITPSTSHPVPPIQPPDVSPDHALSDSDSDLDVADATPEVDLAPPRREKRIPGWLYSTGQQTYEVGESSRPPQTDDEIFRTQLITAVTMFTQEMQNPRFLAFLQPPLPSQQVGSLDHVQKPVKAQAQVTHTTESMETPVHLTETMKSPIPVPNVQEQCNMQFLLLQVPIIPGQVYSINEALSADAAAEDYEFGLRQLVKTRIVDASRSSNCPRFDLILLGMGPDGHVASLFPRHPLTHEKEKWIASFKDSPKPPPERITFTFPVINAAANIAMVLTGANKADVLEKAFGEMQDSGVLPVQMVYPTEGSLVWFLDKPAASKL
ncbi:hypothetical protein L7F22_020790 [Adiantum nelumboides]|nr:hypothetical protein [Adiantum nelumboides]